MSVLNFCGLTTSMRTRKQRDNYSRGLTHTTMRTMKLLCSLTAFALCAFTHKAHGFAFVTTVKHAIRLHMTADAEDDGKKVCLVTGASRGIGRSIALELAKVGNTKLVINHIAPEKEHADEVVKAIEAIGGEAIAIEADCTQPDQIKEMFNEIRAKYGHCDVLVNNAGITRDSLVLRMKPDQWQQVIDLNLSGVNYVSQEFFKWATKRHTGRVVNIASVVGQIGNKGQANYAAAKAGVIGLTKTNAKEFAKRGIKVNAVAPGFISTPMTQSLGKEHLEEIAHTIPLGRLGEPEEVAGMVRFLALDPAADYVTGHVFDIDGGIAIGAA